MYRVQQVNLKRGGTAATVVDENYIPVEPVHRWIRHLVALRRSPRTIETYAYGARFLMEFCDLTGKEWESLSLEDLGQFVNWMLLPGSIPARDVVSIAEQPVARSETTVNLYLSGVWSLYEFHHRAGMPLNFPLWISADGSHTPYKSDLMAMGERLRRPIELTETKRRPKVLSVEQIHAITSAQERLRDRFLFALLATTGIRIGTALGLRHEDFQGWDRTLQVVRRENANGARVKGSASTIVKEPTPKLLTGEVVRLYSEYMHTEYGDLDCDYVFVNLWSGRIGAPMTYATVNDLVRRTREAVGFWFTPHMFRHTFATLHLEAGVRPDIVAEMLDHASSQTTTDIYGHVSPQAIRREMESAGVITGALATVGAL